MSTPPPLISASFISHLNHNWETSKSGHGVMKVADGIVVPKKCVHKALERHRRKHMNTLYSTLLSLLPPENLKGKGSISDRIQDAVDYISDLQEMVKHLIAKKRDDTKISNTSSANAESVRGFQLINSVKMTPPNIGGGSEVTKALFPRLNVNIFNGGCGVEVRTYTFKHQIVFSNLLLALEEEGLEVVSATSSAINDKIFHAIHLKVLDPLGFEGATLYQKLWDLIPAGGNAYAECTQINF